MPLARQEGTGQRSQELLISRGSLVDFGAPGLIYLECCRKIGRLNKSQNQNWAIFILLMQWLVFSMSVGWISLSVLPCVDGCAAPEITEGPVDVTEFVDNRLMMACSARGDPRPSIQWQKRNGTGGRWLQVSRASERYKVQRNGNLVIRRLLASDAGLFRCVAENTVGSAYSAAATLVVQGLPYYPFETFHYFKSGLPRILESTWFFPHKFKALKILESRTGAWKSLSLLSQTAHNPKQLSLQLSNDWNTYSLLT